MARVIEIAGRTIGEGYPVFIVAEMSGNHNHDFEKAIRILHTAKEAGADAVKLQTYTPDTITIQSNKTIFKLNGTIWEGETLYSLYEKAYTPWEWQPKLKKIADQIGLILFSTPFDKTAVDFLEEVDVPAYKIASFEIVDIPLIEYVASKGKPIIMSTGMATLDEIGEAVTAARNAGAKEIALLKCTSSYPAMPEEMNLKAIPYLAETFEVPAGISDHTLEISVPIASVALGASIIEKHFTLSRSEGGPDAAFSIEPPEWREMVNAVRTVSKALGEVGCSVTEREKISRLVRRSLFVVKDMKAGESFSDENVRSIRPGNGLSPRYLRDIVGKTATRDIEKGTPLSWDMVS